MKRLLGENDARGVERLTLSRPNAFNSLSEAMLAALLAEFEAIARVESASAAVPAPAGKAF